MTEICKKKKQNQMYPIKEIRLGTIKNTQKKELDFNSQERKHNSIFN